MAPQKEFESPTFRLGGGRSILLSYWGKCPYILLKLMLYVKKESFSQFSYPSPRFSYRSWG